MANTFRLQPERLDGLAAELEGAHAHDLCPALQALRGVDAALAVSWHACAGSLFRQLFAGWADQLALYGYDLVAIAVFLRTVADEYRRLDGALRAPLPSPAPPAGLNGDSLSQRYAAATRGAPYWALDMNGNLRQLTPAERIAYARALEVQCQLLEALTEMLRVKATSKDGALSVRLGLSVSDQAAAETNPLGGLNRHGAYSYTLGMEMGPVSRAGVFVDAALLKSDTQHLVLGSQALGLTLNHGGRAMSVDAFLGGRTTTDGGVTGGVSIGATLLSLYTGLGLNWGGRNYGLYASGGLQVKAGAVAGSDQVRVDAGPVSFGFEVKDAVEGEPWLELDPVIPVPAPAEGERVDPAPHGTQRAR